MGGEEKRGLLIKGGKYLETLARADVVLIDKTGTLTLGKPHITDILDFGSQIADLPSNPAPHSITHNSQLAILQLAASADRYSEHPLAEAVRQAARERGVQLLEPDEFEALPGLGIKAHLNGRQVALGNQKMIESIVGQIDDLSYHHLEKQGKSLLFVAVDGQLVGALAAADRSEERRG